MIRCLTILTAVLTCVNSNLIAQKNPGYQQSQAIGTPKIFAEGIISHDAYESHPAFTLSGDTVYFVKSAPDLTKWTICVSYFRGTNGPLHRSHRSQVNTGMLIRSLPKTERNCTLFPTGPQKPVILQKILISGKCSAAKWPMEPGKETPAPFNSEVTEFSPSITKGW